jgi:hypothetical protein
MAGDALAWSWAGLTMSCTGHGLCHHGLRWPWAEEVIGWGGLRLGSAVGLSGQAMGCAQLTVGWVGLAMGWAGLALGSSVLAVG